MVTCATSFQLAHWHIPTKHYKNKKAFFLRHATRLPSSTSQLVLFYHLFSIHFLGGPLHVGEGGVHFHVHFSRGVHFHVHFCGGPLPCSLLGGPLLCSLPGGSTSMFTSGGSTSVFTSGGST